MSQLFDRENKITVRGGELDCLSGCDSISEADIDLGFTDGGFWPTRDIASCKNMAKDLANQDNDPVFED